MKYLKIKDEDYEKTEKLLKENDISFEENDPMYFNIEDKRTNPLDIDAIIKEALFIYESEVDVNE